MKKVRIVIVSLTVILLLPCLVFAAENDQIAEKSNGYEYMDKGYDVIDLKNGEIPTPYFNGISSILYRFTVHDEKAWATINISTYIGYVDKVNFIVSVQANSNGSWKTIKKWTKTAYPDQFGEIDFADSVGISSGKYRMTTDIKAYKNGNVVDHVTKTSDTQIY